jgi:hypothetical protein
LAGLPAAGEVGVNAVGDGEESNYASAAHGCKNSTRHRYPSRVSRRWAVNQARGFSIQGFLDDPAANDGKTLLSGALSTISRSVRSQRHRPPPRPL